jgi:hypothetical protein
LGLQPAAQRAALLVLPQAALLVLQQVEQQARIEEVQLVQLQVQPG